MTGGLSAERGCSRRGRGGRGAERGHDGRLTGEEPPELVAEIIVVEGAEGQRLAREQAGVLWEVTRWQAQNSSGPGQDNAAQDKAVQDRAA